MYLEEKLLAYAKADDYPFHMPGHKRRAEINSFLGGSFPLASVDITEIPGFDDLHEPAGILQEEMERAAAFYGTKATLFSVNGSTASNLAAISAVAPFGGRILVSENCRRSVFHAAELRQLTLERIPLDEIAPDVPGPVRPEIVEKLLAEAKTEASEGRRSAIEIDSGAGREFAAGQRTASQSRAPAPVSAVVITSPTYEGVVSDVAAIAEIVHKHGAILIVDEAHGAHFSLHPAFPVSAVKLGADLVTQSLHKTLPSLTQTSVLHNVSGRVSTETLHKWFDIYESSSPSYILMASITSCLHALMKGGSGLFDEYVRQLTDLRGALGELRHIKLAGPKDILPADNSEGEALGRAADEASGRAAGDGLPKMLYDPSKIVILTEKDGVPARFKGGTSLKDGVPPKDGVPFEDGVSLKGGTSLKDSVSLKDGTPLDGPALAEILRRKYGLVFEKTMPHYALAMTSVCDDKVGFERLKRALFVIDGALE